MLDLVLASDLLVAALVGLAVGVEREWSGHCEGPDGRFAGARTFALLGAIGGFAGWFFRLDQPVLATVLVAGGVLFPIVAFFTAMQRPGTTADSTTEVVAILVVALGATAGLGNRTIASAAAAVVLVLLAEKSKLQRALQRVDATEMRAALQFAVLALVILPLLPDRAIGPYEAFRPRSLWIVVLLFSGLNFAGYIARRAIGETRGLGVTGLLGGVVSSTAVTLTFSRRSRDDVTQAEPLAESLALGVVAACTVLVPRVLIVSTVLQPAVGLAALPVLAPAFVAGASVIAGVLWRERRRQAGVARSDGVSGALGQSPLGLRASLQMAVAFQLVLFIIAWVQSNAGNTGVLVSATLLGLTDVDALTVSMTRYGADATRVAVAAAAMGIGVLSNTLLKLVLVLTIGAPRYRRHAASGLLILTAGSVIGLWIGWP
ncbi:MAG: MgtC/SapB family protein [Gemmatimonadaceae bacterium]